MVVIVDELFEIIAQGVGIAESMTLRVGEIGHGMYAIGVDTVCAGVVGAVSVILLICIIVPIQAKFAPEFQILDDFPVETTVHVESLASLLLIGIIHRGDRIGKLQLGVIAIAQVGEVEHGINHHVLHAGVSGGNLCLALIGARSVHLGVGIADRELHAHLFVDIMAQLQAQVVTAIV